MLRINEINQFVLTKTHPLCSIKHSTRIQTERLLNRCQVLGHLSFVVLSTISVESYWRSVFFISLINSLCIGFDYAYISSIT